MVKGISDTTEYSVLVITVSKQLPENHILRVRETELSSKVSCIRVYTTGS